MGQRFRLKADVDISGFSPRMQVILRTMKKYGLILADNGGNWFFQGTHDDRWSDSEINSLKSLHGSDFEAVDITPWTTRPGFSRNSGAVPPPPSTPTAVPEDPRQPKEFTLYQNFPNPFNPSTRITYDLPVSSYVELTVWDLLGRAVATVFRGYRAAGRHQELFAASNLASGVYLYELRAGGVVRIRMMLMMK
jgi:hypothetical protein